MSRIATSIISSLSIALGACVAIGDDISPNRSNGALGDAPSYAGLTLALAGNEQNLYALSMNGGTWRSVGFGRWTPLPASPSSGQVIAVDPKNISHLVVGERAGEANEALNQHGLWESRDGGNHWIYALNPLRFGCSSQVISSVVIDEQSTIFAATGCGVFRKQESEQVFGKLTGPGAPTGLVTALAAASDGHRQPWIWARTRDTFYLFSQETNSWIHEDIPATVGSDNVMRGWRGDDFSLAAYGSKAFTVISVNRPGRTDFGPNCPPTTVQRSAILTFDPNIPPPAQRWSIADLAGGTGTGLGGRRTVKAYEGRSGADTRLFAITAQNGFIGTVVNGGVTWRDFAETPWPPGPCDGHDLSKISNIHPDLWDVHIAPGIWPSLWIASDGGVYRSSMTLLNAAPAGQSPTFSQQNEGLHTHHIHTVSAALPVLGEGAHLLYSTSDNDTWLYRVSIIPEIVIAGSSSAGNWLAPGGLGDTNMTASDLGGSQKFIDYRSPAATRLIDANEDFSLCNDPAHGNDLLCRSIAISQDPPVGNDEFFTLVQTLQTEPPGKFDVAMLVDTAVPGGAPTTNLRRAQAFSDNPDAALTALGTPTWITDSVAVPANARRIWSSGGHSSTTFYAYSEGPTGSQIWRQDPTAPRNWNEITPNLGAMLFGQYGGHFGPLFVDPYNELRIFALTTTGVRVSYSGGATFDPETVLTQLVTGSGRFPITTNYEGGVDQIEFYGTSAFQERLNGNRALPFGSLAQIAFDRDDPNHYVAAAPFTGVFYYKDGLWRDLNGVLPKPLPEVSSVAFAKGSIYVAFEGRGLWRIKGYDHAPLASYFVRESLLPGEMIRLFRSDGAHPAGRKVRVDVLTMTGVPLSSGTLLTDATGAVPAPPGLNAAKGPYVMRLSAEAQSGIASAETAFTWPF